MSKMQGLLEAERQDNMNSPKEHFQLDFKTPDPDLTRIVAQRQRQSFCKRTFRGFISAIAHITFIAAVALLVWVLCQQNIQNNIKFVIILAVVAVVCYIVIFIEALFSNTLQSLKHFSPLKTIHNYIGEVYHARPSITWHAKCYHYGQKIDPDQESLTGYDVQGKTSGKKSVSCSEKKEFEFSEWKEVGRDVRQFMTEGIIRLQCSKLFIFKDEESKLKYMQQYTQFRERCDQMDLFVQHSEEFNIEGFLEQLTAGFNTAVRPGWMKEACYWIFTAVLLTWVYRLWFRLHTKKMYMIFIKEIGH